MGEGGRERVRQGLSLSYNSWAQDTCSQKIGSGLSQGSTMCHFHPARLPSAYLILMCKSIFQGLNFPSSFFMVSTSISLLSNRGGWMIQKPLLQKKRGSEKEIERSFATRLSLHFNVLLRGFPHRPLVRRAISLLYSVKTANLAKTPERENRSSVEYLRCCGNPRSRYQRKGAPPLRKTHTHTVTSRSALPYIILAHTLCCSLLQAAPL